MNSKGTPQINIQQAKTMNEIKESMHEFDDNQQKAQRLQNSIKIQNLPYDYDFWEVLEIFIKVGQISEYYNDTCEMIIVFERQDSVFLSRFFNNHQFGKHEQVLKIAQQVQEKDINGKDFKQFEINNKNESVNTSFADLDFQISGMQFQSNGANQPQIPPPQNLLSNISAKDTPNALNASHTFIPQQQGSIRSQSFIDLLNTPALNPLNTTHITTQGSSRYLQVPLRQNNNSPQVDSKIHRGSFAKQQMQLQKESDRQSTIHSYVRNNQIMSKAQQHSQTLIKGISGTGITINRNTSFVNSINSLASQNAIGSQISQVGYSQNLPSKFGTRIENKIDSDSEEVSQLATRTPFTREKKKTLDQINTSTISSHSSINLEKTKKKSSNGFGNDSENEDIASLQGRQTVRRRTTIELKHPMEEYDCNTEEGLRRLFQNIELPAQLTQNLIEDEKEIFSYYVMRRKYCIFIFTLYLFYWIFW